MSDPAALLRAGDLAALRALFATRVRAEPAAARHRVDLADVMIVQGDLERADAQLDLAATQDPARAVPVALARQLVRAATARGETWGSRRPPELVTEADAGLTVALARLAGAVPPPPAPDLTGTADGRPFAGLRDGDDRAAEILELFTSTGKYVWVSLAQVAALTVHPPERLRDIVWRRADLEVRGGPTGTVYLPATYPAEAMTDAQRLGRETDWIERDDGAVWGAGLRTFLVGEEALALGEFETLGVDGAVAA